MQKNDFQSSLQELKNELDKILVTPNIISTYQKENFLRNLERIRYDIFQNIELENKYNEKPEVFFNNSFYETYEVDDVLKIIIPEVLPKYKNISNPAYKNIMINTANATKEYKGMFGDNLTFVLIIVHEKQKNMDIDNKYVKPIIDGLVSSGVIKDDNFSNMFYAALGKNDTTKPYTEVFVMNANYLMDWIYSLQKMF